MPAPVMHLLRLRRTTTAGGAPQQLWPRPSPVLAIVAAVIAAAATSSCWWSSSLVPRSMWTWLPIVLRGGLRGGDPLHHALCRGTPLAPGVPPLRHHPVWELLSEQYGEAAELGSGGGDGGARRAAAAGQAPILLPRLSRNARADAQDLLFYDVPFLWRGDSEVASVAEAWSDWLQQVIRGVGTAVTGAPDQMSAREAEAEAGRMVGKGTRCRPPWQLRFQLQRSAAASQEQAGGEREQELLGRGWRVEYQRPAVPFSSAGARRTNHSGDSSSLLDLIRAPVDSAEAAQYFSGTLADGDAAMRALRAFAQLPFAPTRSSGRALKGRAPRVEIRCAYAA
jgi:hypothetical protein